ncbi:MAG: hypothetical protein ACK5XM_13300 [Betaproteobacteria bacterium]
MPRRTGALDNPSSTMWPQVPLRANGGRQRTVKQEYRPASPALSLQGKLDQISHDRDVLHLMRELARHGLREGDTVRNLADGTEGRLVISRQDHPPRTLVALPDGSREPFGVHWQRA